MSVQGSGLHARLDRMHHLITSDISLQVNYVLVCLLTAAGSSPARSLRAAGAGCGRL